MEQILISQVHGRPGETRSRVNRRLPDGGAVETMVSQVKGLTPLAKLERQLVCGLLVEPSLLVEQPEALNPEDFGDPGHRGIIEAMVSVVRAGGTPTGEPLMAACRDNDALSGLLAELTLTPTPWMSRDEVEKLVERLHNARAERRRRELQALVANQKGQDVPDQVLAELHSLHRRKSQQVGPREVGE